MNGCSTMEPNKSTAFSYNMSLKQVLVWSVDKDMLKNGVKNLKMPIYGVPLQHRGINYQFMVLGEPNLTCPQFPVVI